jgi:hypothetical protein
MNRGIMQRLIALFLLIAFLSFESSCSRPYLLPSPLSEGTRAKLGNIGIISSEFLPESELFTFAKGRVSGAAKGMAGGAAVGAGTVLQSGRSAPGLAGLFVLVIAAGAAAAGAVIGGIYGTATAIPSEKVGEIEACLKKALIELKMQESLRNVFFEKAKEQTNFNFILIEEGGPKTPDEKINYEHFKGKGIDTVIELGVLSIGFEGKGGKDPDLLLIVDVRTRVVSVSDATVIYENKLEYRSPKRKFTEWIKDEGRPFIEELGTAYNSISEKIVEELFLNYDFSKWLKGRE